MSFEKQEGSYTIAMLIDSDNVSARYIGILAGELEALGHVTVKRIYGDFTSPGSASWKDVLLTYGIMPVQQFAYTTGKNATDSTMIIDAMDILYGGNVDAFCLATSDSDFTRLAARIRESDMFVVGAGEKKTPQSFVKTCDRFLMLDELYKAQEPPKTVVADAQNNAQLKAQTPRNTQEDAVELPREADILNRMKQIVGDDDWSLFSSAVHDLYKTFPQFNYKLYKKDNLKSFFQPKFEFKKQEGTSVDLIRLSVRK